MDRLPKNETLKHGDISIYTSVDENGVYRIKMVDLDEYLEFKRPGIFSSIPSHLITKSLKLDEELQQEFRSKEELIEQVKKKINSNQ